MRLLGFRVKDRITGLQGVVTSVSFDLYGCVQALIAPGEKDGKLMESWWLDEKRLEKIGDAPVMELPSFETIPGPEKLPQFKAQPSRWGRNTRRGKEGKRETAMPAVW